MVELHSRAWQDVDVFLWGRRLLRKRELEPSEPGTAPVSSLYVWLSNLPGPVAAAAVGVSYFLLAQYVIWLNDPVHAGAGYWPANGVTLAALLVLPARRWGWVLGAVVVAEIGGGAIHGYPLAATSWWSAGNVAEPVVAALLLHRFGRGGRLVPLRALGIFFLSVLVVGPLIGAVLGSVGTSTVYDRPALDVALKWWIGDGLGLLVIAPLLLAFREAPIRGRSWLERAGVVGVVLVVALLAFRDWNQPWDDFLPYLVLPAMMWSGVLLGVRGAAVTGFLVAETANLATALGYGPLGAGSATDALAGLQVFLAVGLTSGLLVAVLVRDTLETGKRYERQRSITEILQTAALPERLPTAPGLSLAVRHQAASADITVRVGGDWYDAFVVSGGSTGIVIGDVTGHDLASAAVMMNVRNGLRSLLIELGDPSLAMAAMDKQLVANSDLTLVSAIVAIYTDGDLLWTNAGHPPLLYVPDRGSVQYLSNHNSLLGLGQGSYDTQRLALDPGDVAIGYTDGVVQHRNRTMDDGFAHLVRLLEETSDRDPQALCDLLMESGVEGVVRDDDACVLAIRRSTRRGSVVPEKGHN